MTPEEIHDAIQTFQVPINGKQEWIELLDILSALNNRSSAYFERRISALEKELASTNEVVRQLSDIHP